MKFVMITSSFGIIMSDRNIVNTRFFPANFILAKAYAASVITTSIIAVVSTVKITEFRKYLPSGTSVNAER